jgi:TonB family protein
VEAFDLDPSSSPRVRATRRNPWTGVFVLLSVLGHLGVVGLLTQVRPFDPSTLPPSPPRPMSVVVVEPEAQEKPPAEEPDDLDYEGQIVEIAPPVEERRPTDADYLSRYDNTAPEETRTERFEVNPEVLSRAYSKEHQAEKRDLMDLNAERESTGATVGNQRFDASRDGSMRALPSPWKVTNLEGPQDPVPSAQMSAAMSGAPQNDLLREAMGNVVDLNTLRYPFAGYMERVRRQVNYWWQQNLDNLPSSVRLGRSSYTTEVTVILNGDGALELIDVSASSGSTELDDAVVRAFRLASPFDNPPAGLVRKDGRVYLPDFDFTVQLSAARMQYQGIDPRAGVQFPGILKSPR